MHAAFNRELGLGNDLDICARVHGEQALSRSDFAKLSLLVAEAARLGDANAANIYAQAGDELGQIADSLRRALDFGAGETVPLSYSGGAFSAGDLLLTPFKQALQLACPAFELRSPIHEPHYGAALYAAKLFERLNLYR